MVGLPGFEPGTSCTPSKRASQAALQPEGSSLAQFAPRHGKSGGIENLAAYPQTFAARRALVPYWQTYRPAYHCPPGANHRN